MKSSTYICAIILLLVSASSTADPLGTEFTYQGELHFQGAAANGSFDFEFYLFDVESDGVALTTPVQLEDVSVMDGVFTVELDYGTEHFTDKKLWLEIRVREGSSDGVFTGLVPRQKLTSNPFTLGVNNEVSTLQTDVTNLQAQVTFLQNLLEGVTRGIDGDTGEDTLKFADMNLQIVNGLGSTDTANGTGNLIIGYNELQTQWNPTDGSHMLVIDPANEYTNMVWTSTSGVDLTSSDTFTAMPSASVSFDTKGRARDISIHFCGQIDNLTGGRTTLRINVDSAVLAQPDGEPGPILAWDSSFPTTKCMIWVAPDIEAGSHEVVVEWTHDLGGTGSRVGFRTLTVYF